MHDPTEGIRRQRYAEINSRPESRAALEVRYGQVWNSKQFQAEFDVLGFRAPYVVVRRRADGILGSLEFQHQPRYYFSFQAHDPETEPDNGVSRAKSGGAYEFEI